MVQIGIMNLNLGTLALAADDALRFGGITVVLVLVVVVLVQNQINSVTGDSDNKSKIMLQKDQT